MRIPYNTRQFKVVLAAVAVIGALLSLVARFAVFEQDERSPYTIAVVVDKTHSAQAGVTSVARGVRQAQQRINDAEGLEGRRVNLRVLNDKGSEQRARQVAQQLSDDGSVVAVIGHSGSKTTAAAAPIYQEAGLPLITPRLLSEGATADNEYHFTTVFDTRWETRFLANYIRNIKGNKIASIIRPDTESAATREEQFDSTYRRFGTKLLHSWAYPADPKQRGDRLKKIAQEIEQEQVPGVLVLLGNEAQLARTLVALRSAGVDNRIATTSKAATNGFLERVANYSPAETSPATFLDGMITSTPLLFDISDAEVQKFRNTFKSRHGATPDWRSAYSYEAANVVLAALSKGDSNTVQVEKARERIQEHLSQQREIDGLGHKIAFDAAGQAKRPVRVGHYDGGTLISSLIQLQPMRAPGVSNYLEQIREGRILYVNDRFMYKTRVVYTGLKLYDVKELNPDKDTAKLDFLVWFRSRSPIEPDDIIFANAVKSSVDMGEPVASKKREETVYKAYRVSAEFALNAQDVERKYSHELVGVQYRHAELNRNNVLLVTDLLGMDLGESETLSEKLQGLKAGDKDESDEKSALSVGSILELLGGGSTSSELLTAVAGVTSNPLSGWLFVDSWLSQESYRDSTLGNPVYVGYGRPDPVYSQISFGLMVKPDEISLSGAVSNRWLAYIGIFAFVAAVAAAVVDRRKEGSGWRVQTLALRAVAWPLLLLSVGNLVIHYAIQTMSETKVDGVVLVYNCLWWLVPAALVHMLVNRMVWAPLERRTEQIVPRVVRVAVAALIYILASLGIVAFVFDEKLTSLLATSGVLVTIVGLAIQANIANVFSGIVLNIERPFRIGDMILANGSLGAVTDITWRTVRLRLASGEVTSVPNDVVTQSQVVNYSRADWQREQMVIYLAAEVDPERLVGLFREALDECELVLSDRDKLVKQENTEPTEHGRLLCAWRLYFFHAPGLENATLARNEVWQKVWAKLSERGLYWTIASRSALANGGEPEGPVS